MSILVVFLCAAAALILGYFIYGTFIAKVFGVSEKRLTPVQTMADKRDYIILPTWKVFLIQLLNIAGTGPVFGPILGAIYGLPAVLWIVFGCIFAGAVHDFLSGMLSVRNQGKSIPDIVGIYLGKSAQKAMVVFCLILLTLTGVVFVAGPAGLMHQLTGQSQMLWVLIIFAYYFLATILPVDQIIGKIYPLFGALLVFSALSLLGAVCLNEQYSTLPANFVSGSNPLNLPTWPMVFITIACGALSGFHATQSPIMSRCLSNERFGKPVFYGSMIAEGLIALVWVCLGLAFHPYIAEQWGNPATVVYTISTSLLGQVGAVLAVLGVVALPVTSGDTSFRSARLIIADALHIDQKSTKKCLLVALPLFVVGFILNFVDFDIIWRYFGWSNQMLATIMLWTGAVYLKRKGRFFWCAALPASFMTAVCTTFLFYAPIMGINLRYRYSCALGVLVAVTLLALLLTKVTSLQQMRHKRLAAPKAQ